MVKKKDNFKPKSKEMIKEATDIVINAEDDASAVAFLRDTLEDDFPDLDLGRMDLHEASKVLGGGESLKSKNMKKIEDLNKSLGDFINYQESKLNKTKQTKKKKSRKKRK